MLNVLYYLWNRAHRDFLYSAGKCYLIGGAIIVLGILWESFCNWDDLFSSSKSNQAKRRALSLVDFFAKITNIATPRRCRDDFC